MKESIIEVFSLLEVLDENNIPCHVKIKIHKVVDEISVFKIPFFIIYNTVAVHAIYSVISLGQISVVVWRFFLKISVVVVVRKSLAEI
jgi:hypothetical protein